MEVSGKIKKLCDIYKTILSEELHYCISMIYDAYRQKALITDTLKHLWLHIE